MPGIDPMNDRVSGEDSIPQIIDFNLNSALHANHQDNRTLSQNPNDFSVAEGTNGNPGPTEDPTLKMSGHNASSERPGLSARSGECKDGISESGNMSGSRELEPEPRLSLGLSPNNADRSLPAAGILRQQDGRPSPRSGVSEKGKELRVTEAGSSSGTQYVENNPLNNHLAHLNAQGLTPPPHHISSYEDQLRNMGASYQTPDLIPHLGTNVYPGMPRSYFNPRIHLGPPPNPVVFSPLETATAPLHFEFHPHQSYQQMRFTDFAVGLSPPNMFQMMLGPSVWSNVPQFPITVNSNVGSDVPGETGQASVPANGSMDTFGGNVTYQWPAPSQAYESSQVAVNHQSASDHPPWSLPHQNGLGSEAHYINFDPYWQHTRYRHGYYSDRMWLPGPINQSNNPYFAGPSVIESGHYPGNPELPYTAQPMQVQLNTEDWIIPEVDDFTFPDQGNASHQVQAETMFMPMDSYLPLNLFQNLDISAFQDRLRELSLDIDSMPYEELSELQELIGNVSIGLTEETIMELLARRTYECNESDPSSEAEICSICRWEYAAGEEIGKLDCGHEYHFKCIKQWLVLKNQCPICKNEALSA